MYRSQVRETASLPGKTSGEQNRIVGRTDHTIVRARQDDIQQGAGFHFVWLLFLRGDSRTAVTEIAGRLFPVESNPTCDMLVREQAVCAEA